ETLEQLHQQVALGCAEFMTSDEALQPYNARLAWLEQRLSQCTSTVQLSEPLAELEQTAVDLDMLSTLMASLPFSDNQQQVDLINAISEIYARLNQMRIRAQQSHKEQLSTENRARFAAQLNLLSQSVTAALAQSSDPKRCDEQLAQLLLQLEGLESRFGEYEQFLTEIISKREEILEAFASQRQQLLEEQQRKSQVLKEAARRIIESLPRRISRLQSAEEINTFFSADPLLQKLSDITQKLRALQDSVGAEELLATIKTSKEQALRSLHDQRELFEDQGKVIRLGSRHRFSVNQQPLELTLLPYEQQLCLHLTGTDFRQGINDPQLDALQPLWNATLESESAQFYRGEYLAALLLYDPRYQPLSAQLTSLQQQPEALERVVREFALPRYKEGYQKGIHDHDAALILRQLLPAEKLAGLLRFPSRARALALLYCHKEKQHIERWAVQARTCAHIQQLFQRDDSQQLLRQEMEQQLQHFYQQYPIEAQPYHLQQAAQYLSLLLAQQPIEITFSKYARQLQQALQQKLQSAHIYSDYQQSLQQLSTQPPEAWALVEQWLQALCTTDEFAYLSPYIAEAVVLELMPAELSVPHHFSEADLHFTITGLLGEHPRIEQGTLSLTIDDLFGRLHQHQQDFVPAFQRYQQQRQLVLQQQRHRLALHELNAKPLSSFVRNRLINELYLPIIGDNLAKQIGAAGSEKRTDLMGLLLLISPPGYGKTTLVEYVAHRLGLVFVKINGPTLGHDIRSLDPAQASHITARQEVEKINLALEMGNNVMLYLDDIQHTHPELLQKFISLCDATRRIEGVWQGQSRSYDLRGKRFCVIMAGNPYTESGALFKIPDMLANRADVYNLGEVIGGQDALFALSYIENCLTSHPLLAPLALREPGDLYLLLERAAGRQTAQLSHPYSDSELRDLISLLQHLLTARDVLLQVNQHYIASAAQADEFRTEPPFKLQGSYRNMNKLAEKISPVMNQQELQHLIDDHYLGEAQLLTSGAEENLLKLAEIRSRMTVAQQQRWNDIKQAFVQQQAVRYGNQLVGQQIARHLGELVQTVREHSHSY
ncbi:MAG: AAA family ATPase, partial [Enterobacteriaceae bacterium]